MPPKKVTQTKTRVSDEVFTDEDGKNHLIECSGPGQDGNGCVAWVPVWLPTRLPKNFTERPFLCGYCAFTQVEKLRKEAHGDSKVQETRLSIFLTGCQWTIRTKTKYRNISCGGANRRGCASADCGIQTVFLKKCTLTMWNSRAPLKTRIVLIHSSILFTYPVTIIPGGSHLDQLTDPLFTTLGRCAQITK